MIKKYALYLIRWQLSTPILALCLVYLNFGTTWNTIVANLIGGLIFFWVDKFIFTSKILNPQWEIKDNVQCADCGEICKGFRLIKTQNYDKIKDKNPQFRCQTCSDNKIKELKDRGIII